jgi:hypothetical protein
MVYIAHRGNVNGRVESYENQPAYIDKAIELGYDVEIDMWWVDGRTYLGHDEPQYEVDDEWLSQRADKLWVHCKNVELLNWIRNTILYYFWHTNDDYTLISNKMVLVKPGQKLIENSICCMPEMGYIGDITKCYAIMTDNIKEYEIHNSRVHN